MRAAGATRKLEVRRIHRDPVTGKPTDLYVAGKPLPFLSYASFDHYTDDDLPFGDWLCFPFAFVYAAKHGGVIVHGSVKGGFPERRYEHAWVERGDVVTDSHLWENPATPTMSRADYYRVFKPKVESRYRLDAYRDLVERHQHYGPFFGKRPPGGKRRGRRATPPATLPGHLVGGHRVKSTTRYDAAGVTPLEVARRWRRDHAKANDEVYLVPIALLWPHREYHWRRDCARGGPERWDEIAASLRARGWDRGDPAWVSVGRNGAVLVGEGNHRLAIARAVGLTHAPVRYSFGTRVTFQQDPCAGMVRHGPGPRVTTAEIRRRREAAKLRAEIEKDLAAAKVPRVLAPAEQQTIDEIMALLDGRRGGKRRARVGGLADAVRRLTR